MKNKGLWIPVELLEDENLTLTDQHVIATILSLAGRDGCYASAETIAEMNRCSVKSVRSSVRKGVDLGYLTESRQNGLQIFRPGEKSSAEEKNFPQREKSSPAKEKNFPSEREDFSPENDSLPLNNNKTYYYTRNTRASARRESERGKKEEEKTLPSSFDPEEFFAAALARTERMFKEQGFTDDPNEPLPWQVEG